MYKLHRPGFIFAEGSELVALLISINPHGGLALLCGYAVDGGGFGGEATKIPPWVAPFFAMRAHKLISKIKLASNMRPINVTLDATTWELAKQKTNFSAWVRSQLRSERNKREEKRDAPSIWCVLGCGYVREPDSVFCQKHRGEEE